MMLSLGPTSCHPDRIPPTSLSFAIQRPVTCANISNESKPYSNSLRRPRPSIQISKFCHFPQRKEKEENRRRQVFLKKVREAGDDRKWEQRGDKIMMKDYISNQKQWEAQQVKSAPETPSGPEDEERELTAENAESEGAEIIDEMLQQEREEFEALLCLLENGTPTSGEGQTCKDDYDCEDEEFNRDCLEAVWATEQSRTLPSCSIHDPLKSYLDMDMSID